MVRNGTRAGSLRIYANLVLLIVLVVLTGACRNPVQPELSDIPDTVEFFYTPDQAVLAIDFGTHPQKTVILHNAKGRQVYLVKANKSTSTIPGSMTDTAISRNLVADSSSYPMRQEHEAALRFNANPPPIPQEAQARSLARTIVYGEINPDYEEGITKKDFWVEDKNGNFITIQATLRAIGKYSYVWIADDNYSTSSMSGDNRLNTAQAKLIRDKFDGTEAKSFKDGIFRNVSTIFGHEYGGGDNSDNPGGRDGDQHISILLYDIRFDHSATQTRGIFGYFHAKDFYRQEQLNSNLKTNYAEIFYLDAHFADSYPEGIYSTMAHEYQHMIHFNMKNVRRGLNSATWFNELCSMVAEDLVLGKIDLDPVKYGPQSRLDVFAYHYAESGVSDWLSGDDVLKSYASAFAFGAYLARNFGGAGFFHELMHNDKVNEAAISAAMAAPGAIGNGKGFNQELLRYGEALVLTASQASEDLRSLNREVTTSIPDGTVDGSISYKALAIDLGSIQQYNLYTGPVSGYGMRTYHHPLDVPELRPYGSSIHTQDAWVNIPEELELVLDAPRDSAVRYYLIVR